METSIAETPPVTTTPATNPVARSWLRFRLWHLMLLMLVLAIPLGWIARRLEQMRRWRAAAERLEAMGCHVEDWYQPALLRPHESPYFVDEELFRARQAADPLWLRGMGPAVLGEASFFRPCGVSEPYGEAPGYETEAFSQAISQLNSLDTLHLSRERDPSQWRGAAEALGKLNRLRQLTIDNDVPDDFLARFEPPASMTDFVVFRPEGGDVQSWRRFLAASRIESFTVRNSDDVARILIAARELRALKTLELFDCSLDQAALEALVALRPSERCKLDSCRGRADSPGVQERFDRWGSDERIDFTGDQWRQFCEAGAIDRPREETP